MILEVWHNHEKNIKPNQTEFMYMGSLSRASAFSGAVWLKYAPKGGTQWVSWKHSSVQFSHSVVSNSLRPHESQHARPPCPSPTPGVHPDSRPLSQWCHPAISSSRPLLLLPQSLPASESFPMSQLFTWGGQSTGVSALASFLPNTGPTYFGSGIQRLWRDSEA